MYNINKTKAPICPLDSSPQGGEKACYRHSRVGGNHNANERSKFTYLSITIPNQVGHDGIAISPSLRGRGEEFYKKFLSPFVFKIIALLLLFPFVVQAQKPPVLSLDTILQRIDQNNVQLKPYGLKAESYQYAAEAATAWMAPMVGAGTFMTPYPGQALMQGQDKGSLMFQVEQDIPNYAKLNAQKKYIQSKAEAERLGREVVLNDLRTQAKKLYYTWLVSQQKLAVLHKNKQVVQTMRKIAEIRYPFNQSKLGEVYMADTKIAENENMVKAEQTQIAKSKAWLNTLMNKPAGDSFMIDTNHVPRFVPALAVDTVSLTEARKDIQQMNANIQSMQFNIETIKKQSRPDFKLRFDHMSPLGGMMPQAFSVMGMVSIPIAPWSSKKYKSEVKATQYEVQAMQNEKMAALQATQGVLYGMQQEIILMQQQIATMENKIVPTLQKAMELSLLSYRENKAQLTEAMTALEAFTIMEANVLNQKVKLYLMIADYEKELYR